MEPPRKILRIDSPTASIIDEEITEKDLPLLANVEDVRVVHYILKFKTNFLQNVVTSTATLFLDWVKTEQGDAKSQQIILDACFLNIKRVYSLKHVKEYNTLDELKKFNLTGDRKNFYKVWENDWLTAADNFLEELNFTINKWSMTISGWRDSPSVIRIDYETLPNSPSLDWRPSNENDSNDIKNACVYTPAMPVNNRGLFPCQEPPCALATWEVIMKVENGLMPLLTSDEPGEVIENSNETTTFYFFTSIPLPMSTFAVVVGHFDFQTELKPMSGSGISKENEPDKKIVSQFPSTCDNHLPYPCRFGNLKLAQEDHIPTRLFSLDKAFVSALDTKKFSEFVNVTLETCYENFGPHPFPRLDLVIMPFCYPHMGLASPSMIFLSPSNFSGDDGLEEPLYVCRIPHEICHSWFGLLIGALDWTEEWLSEGFSTYCEDIVFEKTYHNFFSNKSIDAVQKEMKLKIGLRFIALQNELCNTDNELHVLSRDSDDTQQAKNGLEPVKQFMHVHYYKGYLLLWHLASLVGQKNFLRFLKEYVWRYHAQLVSSDIFLQYYYEKFKDELSTNPKFTSVKKLKQEWLETNTLPEPFHNLDLMETDNKILQEEDDTRVLQFFTPVAAFMTEIKAICDTPENGETFNVLLEGLTSSELILLQEFVIRQMHKDRKIGKLLYNKLTQSNIININSQNPEVVHRWCELIILNCDKGRISEVKDFLERHMAMGVYLYGELMISEKFSFQRLAKRVYEKLKNLYDLGTRRILKEMLF